MPSRNSALLTGCATASRPGATAGGADGASHRPVTEVLPNGLTLVTQEQRSSDIVASDPAESDAFFEPARDKIYRHPTFYDIPDEVKTL